MTDLTEKLWPSFQAEVSEQLEAIELALVNSSRNDTDVDALFRYFHTVKGGCAMMGFHSMEDIAHAAEDLLDPVRKKMATLDSDRIEVLLQALDGLKNQLNEVQETRSNPSANPQLLDTLRAFQIAASHAVAATDTPAQALAPVTEVAPEQPCQDIQGFADVCSALLPLIMLSPEPAEHQFALQQAAMEHGIGALVSMLSRPAAHSTEPAMRRLFLGEMMDRLAWLEHTRGYDCGCIDTSQLLRMEQHDILHSLARTAVEEMELLGVASDASAAMSAARQTAMACHQLLAQLLMLQLPESATLARLVRQVLREIERRQASPGPVLTELLSTAMQMPLHLSAGESEPAAYAQMCQQLNQQIRDNLDCLDSINRNTSLVQQLKTQLALPDTLLSSLNGKALKRLADAQASQQRIATILADLESQQDAGEGFLAWLDKNAILINSETVLDDPAVNTSRIRFLVASALSANEIQLGLDELDPAGQFYVLHVYGQQNAPADAAPSASKAAPVTGSTLRIDSQTLDAFVNRVGEMVVLRNTMSHQIQDRDLHNRQRQMQALLARRSSSRPLDDEELNNLRGLLADLVQRDNQLQQTDQRLQITLERMQEDALSLRVVPIGMVFNRLPRVARDVSQAQGKSVQLLMNGDDVRIDKSLLEILIEPLMHMVRNAVDHGIESPEARRTAGKPETATLSLTARQQGNTLLVDVQDDGRGLDRDRILARAVTAGLIEGSRQHALSDRDIFGMIFHPGFSTSDTITELSGRGVGMDVVKTRVTQVGGQVEVHSEPGQGTRFTLKLPLSAAIQNVVLVAAGEQRVAIPERNVVEVINLPLSRLQSIQGQAIVRLRDSSLPVYRLDTLLGRHNPVTDSRSTLEIAVLSDGIYRIGLIVDQVIGRPEIFVRDVHPDITSLAGVGGVSVLGDGSLVIIADCESLFDLALRNAQSLNSLVRTQ